MNVLCVGETRLDTIINVNGFIKENTNNTIKNEKVVPGGCAFISSVLLSNWGHNTYLVSSIGSDDRSNVIMDYLCKYEVDTSYLDRSGVTKNSYVIVNKYNLSKTYISGVYSDTFSEYDYTIPDVILMDGSNYNTSNYLINKYKDKIKIIKASEVNESVTKLCKLSDYIVCDKEFAEIASRERINYDMPDTLKSVINKLESMYKARVIVSLGDKGTLYKVDDKIKVMGSIKVKVSSVINPLDVYFSAFSYGICEGLELEKALKIATISAGLSLKDNSEVLSIPDIREVHKIYGKNK